MSERKLTSIQNITSQILGVVDCYLKPFDTMQLQVVKEHLKYKIQEALRIYVYEPVEAKQADNKRLLTMEDDVAKLAKLLSTDNTLYTHDANITGRKATDIAGDILEEYANFIPQIDALRALLKSHNRYTGDNSIAAELSVVVNQCIDPVKSVLANMIHDKTIL